MPDSSLKDQIRLTVIQDYLYVFIVAMLCIHLYNCSFVCSGSGKEKQPTLPIPRPQQPWLLLKL